MKPFGEAGILLKDSEYYINFLLTSQRKICFIPNRAATII